MTEAIRARINKALKHFAEVEETFRRERKCNLGKTWNARCEGHIIEAHDAQVCLREVLAELSSPAPSGEVASAPMDGWNALSALLAEAQEHDLGEATVTLEEDGDIGVVWGYSSRSVIGAHVSSSGRIGFAALIGNWSSHGSSETHIPDALIIAFRRLRERAASPDTGGQK